MRFELLLSSGYLVSKIGLCFQTSGWAVLFTEFGFIYGCLFCFLRLVWYLQKTKESSVYVSCVAKVVKFESTAFLKVFASFFILLVFQCI